MSAFEQLGGILTKLFGEKADGTTAAIKITDDGKVKVDAVLNTGDIEIGAVEIKNGADDTRAVVGTASGIAETDKALAVQAPVLGVTTGAAVITDANGTIQQYLRGLVKLIIAKIGITIADGDSATLGVTTGAAVITDSNGTIQQYLRGLIKLISGTIATKGIGFSIPATLTVTNGAYSIGDAVGGLITLAGAASAAGKRSVIHTIILAGVAALDYELWFFASDIATPAADNAAFTLVAADVAMCKGVIPISASDYKAPQSAFNVATLRNLGFEFTCAATTLYAYLKAVTITSPGTTTLTLTIKGEYID